MQKFILELSKSHLRPSVNSDVNSTQSESIEELQDIWVTGIEAFNHPKLFQWL